MAAEALPTRRAQAVVVPTPAEASRFLTQATFGPTSAEIQRLSGMSYAAWLDDQFAKPQTLHRLYMNQAAADLAAIGQQLSRTNFFDSYWSQAIGADDHPTTGRVPDLNFAREITQLFSIGEWKLNPDGANVLDANGKPVPAYSGADLSGMSQVFTGFSWYAGPNLTDRTSRRYFGNDPDLERGWRPMQAYNEYAPNTRSIRLARRPSWV